MPCQVEKNGEAPEVSVAGPLSKKGAADESLLIEGHLHFMLMELLKNSMSATLEHWGKDIIDAPPIEVRISAKGNELGIRVSDPGGGIPVHRRPFVWNWCALQQPPLLPHLPRSSLSHPSSQSPPLLYSLSHLHNGRSMPAKLHACLPAPHATSYHLVQHTGKKIKCFLHGNKSLSHD
jgi:hypothetical protein